VAFYRLRIHVEVENRHFCPLYSDCIPVAEYQRNLYIAEKYIASKISYNFVADNMCPFSFV